MTYNGSEYFYLTNLQGDVTGIADAAGATVVSYTYESWGKLISTTGSLATTLGMKNHTAIAVTGITPKRDSTICRAGTIIRRSGDSLMQMH